MACIIGEHIWLWWEIKFTPHLASFPRGRAWKNTPWNWSDLKSRNDLRKQSFICWVFLKLGMLIHTCSITRSSVSGPYVDSIIGRNWLVLSNSYAKHFSEMAVVHIDLLWSTQLIILILKNQMHTPHLGPFWLFLPPGRDRRHWWGMWKNCLQIDWECKEIINRIDIIWHGIKRAMKMINFKLYKLRALKLLQPLHREGLWMTDCLLKALCES